MDGVYYVGWVVRNPLRRRIAALVERMDGPPVALEGSEVIGVIARKGGKLIGMVETWNEEQMPRCTLAKGAKGGRHWHDYCLCLVETIVCQMGGLLEPLFVFYFYFILSILIPHWRKLFLLPYLMDSFISIADSTSPSSSISQLLFSQIPALYSRFDGRHDPSSWRDQQLCHIFRGYFYRPVSRATLS